MFKLHNTTFSPSRLILNLFIIVCISWFILEVGARIWIRIHENRQAQHTKATASEISPGYKTPGLNYGAQDNFAQMQYDPILSYAPRRSFKGNGYVINATGYRNSKELSQKNNRTYRIFILGGSAAFGAGCPQDKTYFTILEQHLNTAYSPRVNVEVFCGGVGAYDAFQEYLRLITEVVRQDPDLVIFLTAANDYYRSAEYGVQPFDGNDYLNFNLAIQACNNKKILNKKYYNSIFEDKLLPPLADDYNLKSLYLIDSITYNLLYKKDYDQEKRLGHKKYSNLASDVDSIASELARIYEMDQLILQKNKVPMLLLIQPTIALSNKTFHPYEQSLKDKFRPERVQAFKTYHSHLLNILQAKKIPYHDINSEMADISSQICTFTDWVHLGEVGQAWEADFLFNLITPFIDNSPQNHTD